MKPDTGESVWGAMDEVGGAELSAAGAARREAMLGELSRAVGVRRARRVAVRGVGVMVLLGAVAAGIWVVVPRGAGNAGGGAGGRGEVVMSEPEGGGKGVEESVEHEALTAAKRGTSPIEAMGEGGGEGRVVRVEMVSDDPGILARYAATAGDRAARIDDEELMRLMNEMGKPTGIVRTAGKVMLTVEMESSPASEPMSEGPPDESVVRA